MKEISKQLNEQSIRNELINIQFQVFDQVSKKIWHQVGLKVRLPFINGIDEKLFHVRRSNLG